MNILRRKQVARPLLAGRRGESSGSDSYAGASDALAGASQSAERKTTNKLSSSHLKGQIWCPLVVRPYLGRLRAEPIALVWFAAG
jgi:hypothetical protein